MSILLSFVIHDRDYCRSFLICSAGYSILGFVSLRARVGQLFCLKVCLARSVGEHATAARKIRGS